MTKREQEVVWMLELLTREISIDMDFYMRIAADAVSVVDQKTAALSGLRKRHLSLSRNFRAKVNLELAANDAEVTGRVEYLAEIISEYLTRLKAARKLLVDTDALASSRPFHVLPP